MDNGGLLIIAGKGRYPQLLLEGARKAKVGQIGVLAFRGQTSHTLRAQADFSASFGIGEIGAMRDWILSSGARNVVFAGQISPAALFTTRFDAVAKGILSKLNAKCAHSIFGAVLEYLEGFGLRVIPASSYMDDCIPAAGVLTARKPDERELKDIERGHAAAMALGVVDVGQTAVVKNGMVLAVEAFEGTNAAIRRGGKLGGRGAVVVKIARDGHDMRFDIPVIGPDTMRRLVRSRISAIALQAGRAIIIDRDETIRQADRHGISIVALDAGLPSAPTRP